MPKHHIYPSSSADTAPAGRLELHWQRDGGVQVASTRWDGTGTPAADQDAWAGQFVELSRSQINHLIKQLRIARDQAYGRDA